ncbi:uncharacterized protein LOC134285313 [Aedes albopictus]|uniref:CCHC-type domain-containing protein n=1 Tax=Aedes albopictus TaxID=7160 RepID=A0ABM1Y252_AEDAL
MTVNVINTVQFRFPPGSPPPTWAEIATFLQQLDMDLMMVESTYKTAQDRSLFVKFKSLEAMNESLHKNAEPRQFAYANGKSVEVRMSIAGANIQYVRVFDLPPELLDDSLSSILGEFGRVENVVREKFPAGLGLDHVYSGVRGVYMDVAKKIPPSISVDGRTGRIFYEALKDTCFLCQELGHRRNSCPQRQSRNKKKSKSQVTSGPSSYADIVSGKETVAEKQTNLEVLDEDIIEVLEEDEDEEYIDQTTEVPAVAQVKQTVDGVREESEKEQRRKKGLETLEEVAKAIHEAVLNSQASQRRAQFAASGSGSGSSSGSGPRMKVPRRTRY